MTILSYDSAFAKHLLPGEHLRWVGRPHRRWSYRWRNRILIVQIAGAIFALVYLAKVANWCMAAAGFDLGLRLGLPSVRSSILMFILVCVTAWQMLSEHRRRAATWYAVTDQRILFVLTRRRPESVVGVEFAELSEISLNMGMEVPGPLNGVILKLKQIDPYMANSDVLGYQVSSKMIFLEDLEDPEEFVKQIVASKMAAAARSGAS